MALIQVCSDIHLEYNDISEVDFINIINPKGEILILAGDIGDPFSNIFEKFINYCSINFACVLFVAGNHEYYNHLIIETDDKITEIFNKYKNVIYLNNTTFLYNNILFVGTTLWSEINKEVELYNMKDFSKIKNFSSYLSNNLFTQNVQFIKEQLKNKIVVITHHAPSYKCISKDYDNDPVNCCYASNLEYLFEDNNLIGWVYGHLHNNYKSIINNSFLYANCYRTLDYNNEDIISLPL